MKAIQFIPLRLPYRVLIDGWWLADPATHPFRPLPCHDRAGDQCGGDAILPFVPRARKRRPAGGGI
jgi:hypothetical protein